MKLSITDVEHYAELARLKLTDAEKAQYATQLSVILDYFDKLSEIDTSDVPPQSHPQDLDNVLREDEVTASLPTEAILANAPDQMDGCFRVPKVLD